MTSVEVKTETKSLRANWTTEMVQDLQTYHGFDIDEFAREISMNMRRENRKNSIKNIFPN